MSWWEENRRFDRATETQAQNMPNGQTFRFHPAAPVKTGPQLPTNQNPLRPEYAPYTYRDSLIGTPPNVFYIRDHVTANQMVPMLSSPLGFDTEWRPNYVKGGRENWTSLIQLGDEHNILLIQISAMQYFPESLRELLSNPAIVKVGVGIRGDAFKLHREQQLEFSSLLDLADFAKLVDPDKWAPNRNPGLAALCETYLERTLKKGKITKSNWEMNPMTKAMQDYAANDAHVSFKIFRFLECLHTQMEYAPPFTDSLFTVDARVFWAAEEEAWHRRKARNERNRSREAERQKQEQERLKAERDVSALTAPAVLGFITVVNEPRQSNSIREASAVTPFLL
ncbi:ribonuclease H-like protein [Dacryopinax primogenitus]|uniref:3'-5' exonuclease n=1 Tax=Dacryopinax primogenitus (strain DJM 731) TaxID=1858805 RepID=M5G548_DACPD|nr:ribonuclease H-like protein [Dacryopinax primogenitus]EJU00962.1 ribonuclease H-like protein [Dacryopinax primogenitus]